MSNIPEDINSAAIEYATQMMGIGKYSEKWPYADKATFHLIIRSYKAGYSLALPKIEELEKKIAEQSEQIKVLYSNGADLRFDMDEIHEISKKYQ